MYLLNILNKFVFRFLICFHFVGFVGKIKLQIPVSRLRSEPWVIFIEKLFLIAGPVLSSEVSLKFSLL